MLSMQEMEQREEMQVEHMLDTFYGVRLIFSNILCLPDVYQLTPGLW